MLWPFMIDFYKASYGQALWRQPLIPMLVIPVKLEGRMCDGFAVVVASILAFTLLFRGSARIIAVVTVSEEKTAHCREERWLSKV